MNLRIYLITMMLIALFIPWLGLVNVSAQAFSAYDLIAAVNSLRANQGLAAYEVDSVLMDYAQQHSNYQASINQSTHTHSDGTSAVSIGIQENIAAGTTSFLTVIAIVNQIWADAVHMNTMVGYASGTVGAGIATSGDTTYVTLNVRPGEASAISAPVQASALPDTPKPLFTSTPAADGSISHIVGYGEALWSVAIAYGVRIDDIRQLNNLAADSNTIFSGQKLLIIPAGTITPPGVDILTPSASPTPTYTPRPPTETLQPTHTALPSLSPMPTQQPQKPPLIQLSNRTVGITSLLIGIIGLVLVIIFGFKR